MVIIGKFGGSAYIDTAPLGVDERLLVMVCGLLREGMPVLTLTMPRRLD